MAGDYREEIRYRPCCSLVFATRADAALLLNDFFNYPDGPLVTAVGSPWTTYSGTAGQMKVVSGRVFLSKANSEDVHATLAGQPYASTSGAILYVSFKLNYTNLPATSGSYFAEFKDGGTGFRGRIFAQTAGAAAGAFRIGIANAAASPSAVFPADLVTNTDYTVVARLSVSNATSTLWINPYTETDAGVTATDAATAQSITAYGFREDGSPGTIGNLFVDDLQVGAAFTDVVTNALFLERPAFTIQPQHQVVTNGANVSFSVSATGTPPPAYQWQFNGADIPEATSSNLALAGVTICPVRFLCLCRHQCARLDGQRCGGFECLARFGPPAFSYLTYNCNGNGLTNWGTNTQHVLAIGRQVQFLNPDIITFNEIPVTNNCTAQMADFVTAFRPGYYLATNSMDDGYIRSVILSRFPIIVSTSRLHGEDLAPYGYTGSGFTRDLFEAQIAVPGLPQVLHVFTVHLKSGQDADSSARRAAEASAVSNFFAVDFPAAYGQQPYVLSGDMNEDVLQPPDNLQSIRRLVGAPTGLQLATPLVPIPAAN